MSASERSIFGTLHQRVRHLLSFRYRGHVIDQQPLPAGGDGSSCECGAHHRPGNEYSGLTRPLYIVYREGSQGLGSVHMRGFQVATSLVNVGYGGPIRVQSLESLYRERPTGAIIVALKTAIKDRFAFALRDLMKRNTLLFDVVDGSISGEVTCHADGFICASVSEYEQRTHSGSRAFLVHHAIDTRIELHTPTARSTFSLGYYGAAANGLYVGDIPEIEVVTYREDAHQETGAALSDALSTLMTYSHHYAVRRWNHRDGYKPLTKAFMAAWCGAVVIASRDDAESLAVLGEDYPYLAPSSAKEDVMNTISFARETLGGPEWANASNVMEQLKALSCPIGSAMSLASALASFEG